MGYFHDLEKAADWLATVRNPDSGWGLAQGSPSSLVNTSEALFVLKRAGRNDLCNDGLDFIAKNTFGHIDRLGPRIRYAAFSLLALVDCRLLTRHADLERRCCDWLLQSRNDDHGWGAVAGDQASSLFPTCLALQSLQQADIDPATLRSSIQWLLACASDTGWRLRPTDGPTPLATAYAVLCLTNDSIGNHAQRLSTGALSTLLQTRQWGFHDEEQAGTIWRHATFARVVPALLKLGQNPYEQVIADAVVYINTLRHPNGGWTEPEAGVVRSIRSQYWAVQAMSAIHDAFDPAIHVPRITAERVQEQLAEPTFVKIAMRSRWATIFPARVYRGITYTLLVLAACVLFFFTPVVRAVNRLTASNVLPQRLPALIGLVFLAGAVYLLRHRPKQFGRLPRVVEWTLGTLAALHLLAGIDVLALLDFLRSLHVSFHHP